MKRMMTWNFLCCHFFFNFFVAMQLYGEMDEDGRFLTSSFFLLFFFASAHFYSEKDNDVRFLALSFFFFLLECSSMMKRMMTRDFPCHHFILFFAMQLCNEKDEDAGFFCCNIVL